MKKDCLTCIDIDEDQEIKDTNNIIPQWYKENGNYSVLPKILSCNDKYNAFKNDKKNWVPETPTITGIELRKKIDIKYTDTWVFYWASNKY